MIWKLLGNPARTASLVGCVQFGFFVLMLLSEWLLAYQSITFFGWELPFHFVSEFRDNPENGFDYLVIWIWANDALFNWGLPILILLQLFSFLFPDHTKAPPLPLLVSIYLFIALIMFLPAVTQCLVTDRRVRTDWYVSHGDFIVLEHTICMGVSKGALVAYAIFPSLIFGLHASLKSWLDFTIRR